MDSVSHSINAQVGADAVALATELIERQAGKFEPEKTLAE